MRTRLQKMPTRHKARKIGHNYINHRTIYVQAILLLLLSIALGACVNQIETAPDHTVATQPAPTSTEQADIASVAPVAPVVPVIDMGDALKTAQWAFVRNEVLYIHVDGNELEIEDCRQNRCDIFYPTWSPGGNFLLYYVGMRPEIGDDGQISGEMSANLLRVARLDGKRETLTDQAAFLRPAGWSPHSETVVYFKATNRWAEEDTPLGLGEVFEVWTAEIEDEGGFGDAPAPDELLGDRVGNYVGEVIFGTGCGGGGRSESAVAYEREGGFAYGYLAGIVEWAADDILLYSNNCTSAGVGRFDLQSGERLEPYWLPLRSLALNEARDAWVAIDDRGQLVMGTPAGLELIRLENTHRAELVYWGNTQLGNNSDTGNRGETFYYTTLENSYVADLAQQVGAIEGDIWVSPFFDEAQASIRRYDVATGVDSLVWMGSDYAYARIHQSESGALLFSAIEPGDRLRQAIEEEQLNAENWRDFLPSVHIQMLPDGASLPVQLFPHAGVYTFRQ